MGEEIKCEYCGKTGFKNASGLAGHIGLKHLKEVGASEAAEKPEEESPEAPLTEVAFAALLQSFNLKANLAKNIAVNVSHAGGPNVFESPKLLLERLSLWSKEITPNMRKLIIEQWFAERGVDIPLEIRQMAGMTTDQLSDSEKKTKEGEGEVRYIYDLEAHNVRMAKEGERGGTLSQAKELKKMAEEDEAGGKESPFAQDAEGNWMLNPKARVGGVELMAFQSLKQAQEKGEPFDPITAMTKASEQMRILREGFGGGASALPAWMTDPAAFITTVKSMAGGTEGDSASKAALAAMQKTIEEMKEDRWRVQFEAQQKQIQDVTGVLNRTLEAIADMKKERVGRTEMDILDKIATEGIGLAKTELPGLRRDIKEAISSIAPPLGKTSEQREDRKKQFKQALDTDKEIEELGRRVFFSES